MNNKFKVVESRMFDGIDTPLMRIQAIRSFGSVKEGDLGGWIESEKTLSDEGNCWIGGEAKVFNKSTVSGNAVVTDEATVTDSDVMGNSHISGNAVIYSAKVGGNTIVKDSAWVESTCLFDSTEISEHAQVYGIVSGMAKISGNAVVYKGAQVRDEAEVSGDAQIYGAVICNAKIMGTAKIREVVTIGRDGFVFSDPVFIAPYRQYSYLIAYWSQYGDMIIRPDPLLHSETLDEFREDAKREKGTEAEFILPFLEYKAKEWEKEYKLYISKK